MAIEDGGAAFPTKNYRAIVPESTGYSEGMTLRDYFAIHCAFADIEREMCNVRWRHANTNAGEFSDVDAIALVRYRFADAMLKARA